MASLANLDFVYWQELERSEKLAKLFDSGLLSDCKFIVGPDDETSETFIGHKIFFALESPVFERMLTNDKFCEGGKNSQIRIDDIEPQDFKNFRDIIYSDVTKITKLTIPEIMALYNICKKYIITSISNECIKHLKSILANQTLDSLILLFQFSCGVDDKTLKTEIEKKISSHPNRISEKLNELSQEVFYEYILYMTQLKTISKVIFQTIDTYFKHNRILEKEDKIKVSNKENAEDKINVTKKGNTDKIKIAKKEENGIQEEHDEVRNANINNFKSNILKLVDFDGMTIKDFIAGPGGSDLLDAQQKYDILSNLCIKRNVP